MLSAGCIVSIGLFACLCLLVFRARNVVTGGNAQEILNCIGDGILVLDSRRRILMRNQRFAELWQVPESLLESKNDEPLLQHVTAQLRDPDGFRRKLRELYNDWDARSNDVLELADGRIYEGYSEARKLRGGILLRVWGFRDVTELRRTQAGLEEAGSAAEKANRAKSEFLANMSHEIRTPMNGMLGMVGIVLDTELNAEQRECLEMAKLSGENLLAIVNDITDLSRIEAGKLEFDPVEFDLSECVERTCKSLALSAHQKGLEIICSIAESVPALVVGDPIRLRQILVNLISNAVKFTGKGEVVVAVSGQRFPPSHDSTLEVRFAVRDTGIGIRPEHQRKIFEPFSQADASMTRRYGGSGLGLSISQRLLEMMGGRIWVESELGRGSTFGFVLPLNVSEELALVPESDQRCSHNVPILLVDGNTSNREVLGEYLSRWGFPVQSAGSTSEAIGLMSVATAPFRLVMADTKLNKIDDLELAVGSASGKTALILMGISAKTPCEVARDRNPAVAASLTKPLARTELRETIFHVIANLFKPPTPDGATILPRGGVSSEAAVRPLKILLAEDNAVNQKLALRLLQREGHRVTVARNGREALEAAGREAFDLVLMDIVMPELDGMEATAAIRASEAMTGGRVPIIALTAHAMSDDRERCLAAGMDDYITKPIRRADLLKIINELQVAS